MKAYVEQFRRVGDLEKNAELPKGPDLALIGVKFPIKESARN